MTISDYNISETINHTDAGCTVVDIGCCLINNSHVWPRSITYSYLLASRKPLRKKGAANNAKLNYNTFK